MTPDIEKAKILQASLDLRDAEIDNDKWRGPNEGPCPICKERGLIQVDSCIRYCMCRTGREKKREWFSLPAADRAPFEAAHPTVPDAEDLAVRKRGA
jgi:hypothetical protein